MREAQAKAAVFEQLARVGKALGNGKRLELIELLLQCPRGVVELAQAAGLSVATTSAHLQIFKQAGLVTTTRDGTTIRYSIVSDDVARLYGHLREVAAAHIAEVNVATRRYLGPDDGEAINREELLRRVGAGEAVLLDVRPAKEFAAGHLPGAVSIPLDELAQRLGELPSELEVVAYCRGPYCAFSHVAVELLKDHGYRAGRLDDGVLEWQMAGLSVSRDADRPADGPAGDTTEHDVARRLPIDPNGPDTPALS